MPSKPVQNVLTVVIDALIIIAVALAVRLVVVFSGQISAMHWAQAYNALTSHLVIPFGFHDIKTPYGGVFDVDNAATIVVVLVAEWLLSIVRERA